MARKRQRYRASDLAPARRNPFLPLVLVIVALAFVLLYKSSSSDKMATFLESLALDPDLVLPTSVLERDAGVPDAEVSD